MEKVDIRNTQEHYLDLIYKHLCVQSLLDLKAVNGEITKEILYNLHKSASISKTVFYGKKIAYSVFVIPTDDQEHSIFMISTTIGNSQGEELSFSFKEIIKSLPKSNFYSIVYKGNHKYSKILKENGFEYIRNITHGVENRVFFLLGKGVENA